MRWQKWAERIIAARQHLVGHAPATGVVHLRNRRVFPAISKHLEFTYRITAAAVPPHPGIAININLPAPRFAFSADHSVERGQAPALPLPLPALMYRAKETVTHDFERVSRSLETDRIFRTTRRIEHHPNSSERVVVTSAATAASMNAGTSTSGSAANLPSEIGTPASRPWPAAPASPPVSVDQIADQVTRRLDQRLIAWSERTGRV